MKIMNNITILINGYWLRNITRYEQYYSLSLVSYKFLILNLSLTITFIKLGTFFCLKSQGGGVNVPRPPVSAPAWAALHKWSYPRNISRTNIALFTNKFTTVFFKQISTWAAVCLHSSQSVSGLRLFPLFISIMFYLFIF